MPLSRNQKGVIHFGILGILILVAGLFAASRLASNPDLTFFNIAEEAKDVAKDQCKNECKNGKLFYWDRKSNSCKKKDSVLCKARAGVGMVKRDKAIQVSTPQNSQSQGNSSKSCGSACTDYPIKGIDLCRDSDHPNGWYCCPPGRHVLYDNLGIAVCSKLVGNPPPCPTNGQCSTSLSSGGSLCFKTSDPDTPYYCR